MRMLSISARLSFFEAAWEVGTRLGLFSGRNWSALLYSEFPGIATGGGFAIMSVWAIAARGRLFRPPTDWIEGAGRIIRCLWIACFLLQHCLCDPLEMVSRHRPGRHFHGTAKGSRQ